MEESQEQNTGVAISQVRTAGASRENCWRKTQGTLKSRRAGRRQERWAGSIARRKVKAEGIKLQFMYLNPCVVLRGIVRDAKHTYTHPPERVILIACLAFTAIGSRQIVAQLALSALMEIVLALVHIYKTHNGKDMWGGVNKTGDDSLHS